MINGYLADAVGLAGIAAICGACWMIWQPLGVLAIGVALVVFAILLQKD